MEECESDDIIALHMNGERDTEPLANFPVTRSNTTLMLIVPG